MRISQTKGKVKIFGTFHLVHGLVDFFFKLNKKDCPCSNEIMLITYQR